MDFQKNQADSLVTHKNKTICLLKNTKEKGTFNFFDSLILKLFQKWLLFTLLMRLSFGQINLI